ncbi:hypothetical protein PTSG_01681 [Salpingoeca rosetta]|uniref:Beta-catenin-like protein 1 N-terminal domain-containing protein n=1 Tax=Salpingoeca rosetta (strain ATCC 50818 / BSB-021) TaxID=946362 RepID=F2TYM8_SALR5|nr:uncharacterized protein PTSG_01681 [Salpingoeca rosetta]EGD78702.1 hypothetical protein PTSG_01681 [Salpingoeca rosetta]|eukprot:XP_004997659.1 hypothetical protein PTSG_01681 [Salpingoeca rosetta]
MDPRDLAAFQPKQLEEVNRDVAGKRAHDAEGDSDQHASKRAAVMSRDDPMYDDDGEDEEEQEKLRILRQIQEDKSEVRAFDATTMKKLALGLERKFTANQQMRIKHPDEPLKFMESEVQLHDEIKGFSVAATAPQHYGALIRLNTPATLIALLGHENTDIVVATINVLQEMTDLETSTQGIEQAAKFADALMENDFFDTLLPSLDGLNEARKDEAEAIHNTMSIIEHMIEMRDTMGETLVLNTRVLPWLIARIKRRYGSNTLYASELLAMLLQQSEKTKEKFGKIDGIDALLQTLARYRKMDPASDEEAECMENIFDSLCSAILLEANKARFMEAEGVELMVRLLRQRKLSRFGALKVVDFITTEGEYSRRAADIFLEQLGLAALFPLLMKIPKMKKFATYKGSEGKLEEHVVSLLASLLRELRDTDRPRQRILAKFVEKNFEKCVRLAELHEQHSQLLQRCERQLEAEREHARAQDEVIDEEYENEEYLDRLDNGLTMLQYVDYVVAEVVDGLGDEMRSEMIRIFKLKRANFEEVKTILEDYAENTGEADKEGTFGHRLLQLARTVVGQHSSEPEPQTSATPEAKKEPSDK